MAKHSLLVGGSSAERILNCAGSLKAVQALPTQVTADKNEFADYGTAMHAVMERVLSRCDAEDLLDLTGSVNSDLPAPAHMIAIARKLIGEVFYDRVLTQEHIDESIEPAIYGLHEIANRCGGGCRVAARETRVKFPSVAGAFGTADLLLTNATHTILVDFKFGQGVPVKATYETDDGGEIINAQLMFYLAGAMRAKPSLFRKKRLVVAILQPRVEVDAVTMTEVKRIEVRHFIEDVERAVVAALQPNPPLKKGNWCRWCPAKTTCPEWTGPMQELIQMMGTKIPAKVPDREITPYALFLARAKLLAEMAVMFKKEIDDQLLLYLDAGGEVPGWHLKMKSKQRKWVDPFTVAGALKKLGFERGEIFQPAELVTFKSADATAKRLGVRIPDELRVAPPSTEVTLASDDDPAPIVNRQLVVEQFAAALEDIRKREKSHENK